MEVVAVGQVALHPLLGQLVSGIVIVNINAHWLTGGLKKSWSAYIRVGALALIFLRSGLELDWEVSHLPSMLDLVCLTAIAAPEAQVKSGLL